MDNPYSMVFGKEPELFVSRATQENKVINDLVVIILLIRHIF